MLHIECAFKYVVYVHEFVIKWLHLAHMVTELTSLLVMIMMFFFFPYWKYTMVHLKLNM